MANLTFSFVLYPGSAERQAVLLAKSIRTFAGSLALSPILANLPEGMSVSVETLDALQQLNVTVSTFPLPDGVLQFPFAGKVYAAAHAEQMLEKAGTLAWIDRDCVVVQPPEALLLPKGKSLGFKPVDHTLIGSVYHQPIDSFWEAIYCQCGVDEQSIFPLAACADGQVLRAYFNAGLLVVRPERGLLRSWRDSFLKLYQLPAYESFYQANALCRIFMHQAVLSGIILSSFDQTELIELPRYVNYPLNLHTTYPDEHKPARINDVVSFRYDTLFDDTSYADLCSRLPIEEPLRTWIGNQLLLSPNNPGRMRLQ